MFTATTEEYSLPRGRAVHFLRAAGLDEAIADVLEADSVTVEVDGESYSLRTHESGIFYRDRTSVVAEGALPGSYGLEKIQEVGEPV